MDWSDSVEVQDGDVSNRVPSLRYSVFGAPPKKGALVRAGRDRAFRLRLRLRAQHRSCRCPGLTTRPPSGRGRRQRSDTRCFPGRSCRTRDRDPRRRRHLRPPRPGCSSDRPPRTRARRGSSLPGSGESAFGAGSPASDVLPIIRSGSPSPSRSESATDCVPPESAEAHTESNAAAVFLKTRSGSPEFPNARSRSPSPSMSPAATPADLRGCPGRKAGWTGNEPYPCSGRRCSLAPDSQRWSTRGPEARRRSGPPRR